MVDDGNKTVGRKNQNHLVFLRPFIRNIRRNYLRSFKIGDGKRKLRLRHCNTDGNSIDNGVADSLCQKGNGARKRSQQKGPVVSRLLGHIDRYFVVVLLLRDSARADKRSRSDRQTQHSDNGGFFGNFLKRKSLVQGLAGTGAVDGRHFVYGDFHLK